MLTSMTGWQILKRDLALYREGVIQKLAYINPKRHEFNELRIHFLAADKMISLVEDYKVNKELMMDYLNKLQNPDLVVPLDMDNEGASPEIENE